MIKLLRPAFQASHRIYLAQRTITTMSPPHPVILCGKTEAIGAVVIENLKPELESPSLNSCHPRTKLTRLPAIEFVQTVSAGRTLIPSLLRGETPPSSASTSGLGTKDYEKMPVAVILGAAFDDQGVEELRDAAKGSREVPWLRPDAGVKMPPPGPEYGRVMVERIKKRVRVLEDGGMLGEGGVVWF